MNIIIPIEIKTEMIQAGTTLSEPHTGEQAWVSGTSYTAPQEVIRVDLHSVYRCSAATSFVSTTAPELDPDRWTRIGPTRRWAAFDLYKSTAAYSLDSLTYNIKPNRFFNALMLVVDGAGYSVTIRASSDTGAVLYQSSASLYDDALGFYEYLFGGAVPTNSVLLIDLPLHPDPHISITVTNGAGVAAKIGAIVLGDYTPIIGAQEWGGTEWGASVEPRTYSTIEFDGVTGELEIQRRYAASGLRFSVVMPLAAADAAVRRVQSVLDIPVACIATEKPGFLGLMTVGLISGSFNYRDVGVAVFDGKVDGVI